MSKYQFAESDIYLPGTDIPRNHLGIETPDETNHNHYPQFCWNNSVDKRTFRSPRIHLAD